jgi:exosortase H (IPTLxxWG-CTERM-specific)
MKGKMKAERATAKPPDGPASPKKQTLRFLGIFFSLITMFYVLTLSTWVDARILFPVMKASARGTSLLLNLIGSKTTVDGLIVRGPDCAVAVRRGCDPLEPIVLFAAAVIAFPARWRARLAGILLAAVFLFGLNLVRVASLYLLRAKKSPLFESLHLVWWPAFFIAAALALWVLWLRWTRRPQFAPPLASSTKAGNANRGSALSEGAA